MKKVLITGGSGLVGRFVAQDLAKKYDITVLDRVEPNYDVKYHSLDVLNTESFSAIGGQYDALLHLAGIPHPLNDPPERVFNVNTLGTFNVAEFAVKIGVKKVVLASSESTLGFAFARTDHIPLYFPIDEQHPLEPQDPYGLSKVCAEEILKCFSRGYRLQTVSLRFPWIWVPGDKERQFYRKLIAEYPSWSKNLWAWVNVHDAAQAFAKAIEFDGHGFNRFFITAAENWTGYPAMDLIDRFYKGVQIIHSMEGPKSLISSDLAHVVLHYTPKFSVADIFD